MSYILNSYFLNRFKGKIHFFISFINLFDGLEKPSKQKSMWNYKSKYNQVLKKSLLDTLKMYNLYLINDNLY